MAPDRLTDPAVSINPNLAPFPTERDMEHLHYRDQLSDSLHKLQAMVAIFSCSSFEDFNENVLQWFSIAMLDTIHLAMDAESILAEMESKMRGKLDFQRAKG